MLLRLQMMRVEEIADITVMRNAETEDVPEMVNIHLCAFRGFFLTFLGANFLRELYRSIVVDASGISIVAEGEDGMCGFVTGTTEPSGLYSRILRERWWHFGWAALLGFIRNPAILSRLVRAFSKPHQEHPVENCGELMSIAVHPETQGHGVGKQLIQAFLDETRQRGLDYVTLTTDAENNDDVNKFYLKLGFNQYRSYVTPEKRVMNVYVIYLWKR